jgi:hypothetical protein
LNRQSGDRRQAVSKLDVWSSHALATRPHNRQPRREVGEDAPQAPALLIARDPPKSAIVVYTVDESMPPRHRGTNFD